MFINQIRMKIGVMFGSPETTTGGNALKFYASMRLDIRRVGAIKNGEDVIGNRTRVKVVKNKLAAPFKQCEFDILYGKGICKEGDLLDLATGMNLIEKSGTWYSYSGERLGQGRDAARDFLKNNPKLLIEIREKVLHAKGIENKGSGATPAASEEKSPSMLNGKVEAKPAHLAPPPKAAEKDKQAAKARH